MSKQPNLENNEIDLSEVLSAFWAHKIFISVVTVFSILLAGYHALTTQKKFTARAVFHIEQQNNNSFNIPGELGALASWANLSAGDLGSVSDALLERIRGREFILKINSSYLLDQDPFFNSFDPNHEYKDPFWKATIKKIVGWEKIEADDKAIIENSLIAKYQRNIKFKETGGGAISISVTHTIPQKASEYANALMQEILNMVQYENEAAKALRLNYLSETLADAIQEMEYAQKRLKDYALRNSALAQENFISGSLKLDDIRMERRKAEEISNLLIIIESQIKSNNIGISSYNKLRSKYPLVDDIDFRRILGMSESISAWTWPDIEIIEAVSATLRDRIKRLDIEISNIEDNAKIYATSAEDLAKFTRDAKIAEATYTVLIEQVKSQSLAAGFETDTFKVFEYAAPPLAPSSPDRKLIITLGGIFGLFLGCAFAFINLVRSGVFYTKSTLISATRAELTLKTNTIKRLSRRPISKIIDFMKKRKILALDEAEVKLSDKKLIYVLNSGGKLTASDAARLLTVKSAQSGRKVVLCDTTGRNSKESDELAASDIAGLPILSIGNNINFMSEINGTSFFTSNNFKTKVEELKNSFDQVLICANRQDANLGLLALEEFNPSLVIITGLRSTRKLDISKIRSKYSVDIMFYD